MTKRELRLLFLAIFVGFLAALDFAWTFYQKNFGADSHIGQSQEARAKAAIARILPQTVVSPQAFSILENAATPIAVDPLAREFVAHDAVIEHMRAPLLNYMGHIDTGSDMIAIINGNEYHVGDTVEGTDEEVVAISTLTVTLVHNKTGHERELVLPDEIAVLLERSKASRRAP